MTGDAFAVLRKFTESDALELSPGSPPRERLDPEAVYLTYRSTDGWTIGLRVEFTAESWAIAQVMAIPAAPVRTPPILDIDGLQSYIETAVGRARKLQVVTEEQLEKMKAHAKFIQERFEAWLETALPRTNVEYAALAAKYAEQVRLGNTRATATLAELVHSSPSVMAQRIKEARRRALLTRGEQGRASGVLTPLGALYADPDFPGIPALRRAGMTLREIADKYGMSEGLLWQGVAAAYGLEDEDLLPERERAVPLPSEE